MHGHTVVAFSTFLLLSFAATLGHAQSFQDKAHAASGIRTNLRSAHAATVDNMATKGKTHVNVLDTANSVDDIDVKYVVTSRPTPLTLPAAKMEPQTMYVPYTARSEEESIKTMPFSPYHVYKPKSSLAYTPIQPIYANYDTLTAPYQQYHYVYPFAGYNGYYNSDYYGGGYKHNAYNAFASAYNIGQPSLYYYYPYYANAIDAIPAQIEPYTIVPAITTAEHDNVLPDAMQQWRTAMFNQQARLASKQIHVNELNKNTGNWAATPVYRGLNLARA